MTVKYIPPRDPNEGRVERIQDAIIGVLNSHISGRGKETKIKRAADDIINVLRPLLKLSSSPSKGATVMTEAATKIEGGYRKGPSNL